MSRYSESTTFHLAWARTSQGPQRSWRQDVWICMSDKATPGSICIRAKINRMIAKNPIKGQRSGKVKCYLSLRCFDHIYHFVIRCSFSFSELNGSLIYFRRLCSVCGFDGDGESYTHRHSGGLPLQFTYKLRAIQLYIWTQMEVEIHVNNINQRRNMNQGFL